MYDVFCKKGILKQSLDTINEAIELNLNNKELIKIQQKNKKSHRTKQSLLNYDHHKHLDIAFLINFII